MFVGIWVVYVVNLFSNDGVIFVVDIIVVVLYDRQYFAG